MISLNDTNTYKFDETERMVAISSCTIRDDCNNRRLLRGDHDRLQRPCSVEEIAGDGSQGGRQRHLPQATAIGEGTLEVHHSRDCHDDNSFEEEK